MLLWVPVFLTAVCYSILWIYHNLCLGVQFRAIMNKASMSILLQVFFVDKGLTFLGYKPMSGIAWSQGRHLCTLLGITEQFSKVAVTFYTPASKYESFSCSPSSSTLDIVSLLNFGHSGGCIVVTHGLNLHFPSE